MRGAAEGNMEANLIFSAAVLVRRVVEAREAAKNGTLQPYNYSKYNEGPAHSTKEKSISEKTHGKHADDDEEGGKKKSWSCCVIC